MKTVKYLIVFLLGCFCATTVLAHDNGRNSSDRKAGCVKACHHTEKCVKQADKTICKKVKVCKKEKA